MKKFSQSLPMSAFDVLEHIAKERQLNGVPELIRAVIVPEWVRDNPHETKKGKRKEK